MSEGSDDTGGSLYVDWKPFQHIAAAELFLVKAEAYDINQRLTDTGERSFARFSKLAELHLQMAHVKMIGGGRR